MPVKLFEPLLGRHDLLFYPFVFLLLPVGETRTLFRTATAVPFPGCRGGCGFAVFLRGVVKFTQPLLIIAVSAYDSVADKPEHTVTDPIEQVTVVGDEQQGAVKVEQALFEDIERGDVKIIGRLVEQQDIGRLPHQFGDQDTGLLTAGQLLDRGFQLIRAKEEAFGPGNDVNRSPAEENPVPLRGKCPAQGRLPVDTGTVLGKADHPHAFRNPDLTTIRGKLPAGRRGQDLHNGRLAAAIGPHQTDPDAG